MLFKNIFLSIILMAILHSNAKHLCSFGIGPYEEHLCEIVLNLDQRFWRGCCLKILSSTDLVAYMLRGADTFVQSW